MKGVGQAKIDVIIPGLDAERGFHQPAGERPVEGSRRIRARHDPVVVLMKLIALGRIGQKISEIVEQIEFAFDDIGVGLPRSGIVGPGYSCRERKPVGVAAIGRVFLAVKSDLPRRDRPLRHLVGRIPFVRIGHAGDGKPVLRRALAVAQQAVDLAHVVRIDPRPVIGAGFARKQQRAVAHFGRAHAENSLIAEAADGHFRDVLVDAVDQADVEIAGRGEVALVGKIRSLANLDRIDRFRHQPVQIRIALAMGMGAHIDRHVVDPDRHVGAVIEIIAAQKILVGFALAAVLRHDQAGHRLQYFPRARHRTRVEFFAGHRHLARHVRRPCRPRGDIRRAGWRCRRLVRTIRRHHRFRRSPAAARVVSGCDAAFHRPARRLHRDSRQRLGLAGGSPGSAGAGPAASGPDCAWADAVCGSAGTSAAINASLRNALDTRTPIAPQRRNARPEIRGWSCQAHNRGLSISRIVLLSNGKSVLIRRV